MIVMDAERLNEAFAELSVYDRHGRRIDCTDGSAPTPTTGSCHGTA